MKTVKIRIDHIDASRMHPPYREKLIKYFSYYNSVNKNNTLMNKANPIVVDAQNRIIDGFCTYFIVSRSNQKTIQCIKTDSGEKLVKVVLANHIKNDLSLYKKLYAWKVKKIPVVPNDVIYVNTSDGRAPILIKDIVMLPRKEAASFSTLTAN